MHDMSTTYIINIKKGDEEQMKEWRKGYKTESKNPRSISLCRMQKQVDAKFWLVNTWAKLKQKRMSTAKLFPPSTQPFVLLFIADIFVSYDFFKIISSSKLWPSIFHFQNFIFIQQHPFLHTNFLLSHPVSLKFVKKCGQSKNN